MTLVAARRRGADGQAGRGRRLWPVLCELFLLASLWPVMAAGAASVNAGSAGEAIFRRGQLGNGQPLQAVSKTGAHLEGQGAACANCHRRSGLGAIEGRSTVPPITGRYLFQSPTERGEASALPYVVGIRGNRAAYTEATLVRAIREGLDSEGNPLGSLMPRFQLDDREAASLVGYLKSLDRNRAPGITDSELQLATVITPDADPVATRGMLDVLKQFVADTNAIHFAAAPPMQPSARTQYSKSMLRAHRKWILHVWQLEGPADTWQAQLDRRLAAEPVFAVLSGLAGTNWAPVQAFCEKAELPCLFPNVEAPPRGGEHEYYTTYFSEGVLLEADLIADAIKAAAATRPGLKVRQIYRAGSVGEAAARALEARLGGGEITTTSEILPSRGASDRIDKSPERLAPADVLVLWLRPDDIAALTASPPPAQAMVYLSGLMGDLERAPLPPTWRTATRIALPVDLPERRRVRVDFAMGWFALRRVPIVAPRVQADTYLACGLLSEALNHSADVAVRDYLLEKFEDMIERRVLTGYYPRLSLAPGQRFASKGGYLVRFAGPTGTAVVPEGGWTVP